MRTLEEHRTKLKEIADYAFKHGIESIDISQLESLSAKNWGNEQREKFFQKCHDGFKIAQKLLIEEITIYQNLLRKENNDLKEIRRNRNKEEEKNILGRIEIIEIRLNTLSHIADGMAWHIIGGQIHIARRFHIGQKTSKFLDYSNIEHAISVADKINENPNDFALISDLTSFIQIGDILVKHKDFVEIMELKEGKVNDLIADFFKAFEAKGESFEEQKLEDNFDVNTIKQIKRMQRQKERTSRVTEIINTDEGTDPVSGEKIKIFAPKIKTEYYRKELSDLQEKLTSKNWSYQVVDACLHIGMYKDESILMAKFLIEEILKAKTNNYIIVDWLSITENLSEPIFAKPFTPEFIIDVLTGKVKIIIGLNLDVFIEILISFGINSRWLTEKETTKVKQKDKRKSIVVVNKKAISMILPSGTEIILSGGLISKILYDNIKPINIVLTLLDMDNEIK